jgi:hypothetical protein
MTELITAIRARLRTQQVDMHWSAPPPPKPADPADIAADEKRLGFALPPLLKRIYVEIGNGGFGPGYGLTGLTNVVPDDLGHTVPASYELRRHQDPADSKWKWPFALLPICHWGCAIVSCVDCSNSNFAMRVFDPNVHDDEQDWTDSSFDDAASFEAWIGAWADGGDLWEKMYGGHGHIARILSKRHPSR